MWAGSTVPPNGDASKRCSPIVDRGFGAAADVSPSGNGKPLIDHWAYFSAGDTAEQFAASARREGYVVDHSDVSEDGMFRVQFHHTGTVRLKDIASHTIKLRRMASAHRGNYDGWETPVCKIG